MIRRPPRSTLFPYTNALPIWLSWERRSRPRRMLCDAGGLARLLLLKRRAVRGGRSEEHTSELQSRLHLVCRLLLEKKKNDRRSTQAVRSARCQKISLQRYSPA